MRGWVRAQVPRRPRSQGIEMRLLASLRNRLRRVVGTDCRHPDPARVAELTAALARLDREIARIRRSDGAYARAHHLHAAVRAYGDVLDEARRVAGIPAPDGDEDVRRMLAEVELRTRGWDW
ncbi:MAG: hypothetical protein ACFCVG_02290 [Kineosporiaceae bacterium]